MTAKEYLGQVKKLDALIECKLSERQKCYDMITNVNSSTSGMPHASGVSDKVGNGVAMLMDLEKELDELIDKYVEKKKEIQSVIEQLPADEYKVLYKRYFDYKTFEQIANEMSYSQERIYDYYSTALEKVNNITVNYS